MFHFDTAESELSEVEHWIISGDFDKLVMSEVSANIGNLRGGDFVNPGTFEEQLDVSGFQVELFGKGKNARERAR